ncbi:hypothetical protein ILUMI_00109 [Ignelater luminosus]|uniref:CRAL-TRIO domain-containing protein n=1 Tax=Ignelater luminosus TaxID=2038154 RepID=A0A8K0DGW0_IGNLU|nr:hypothetical protein ILUMI_00109 [Ignelater luminosus]
MKVSLMILDILMNDDDNYVIAGQEAFGDLKGLTVSHAVQVTPSVCKKLVMCVQNSYPTRPKRLIFTNVPSVAERLFHMVKALLKEKIRNRVHVYSEDKLTDLYQVLPQSVLPKEYGGEGDSIAELTVHWKKKVESYKEWFLEDEKYGSNEKLRPGRSYTSAELFGIEGSFRKLMID